MIELAGYSFQNSKASIVCTHVWNGHPVLLYAHDSDGDIQFYCGKDTHAMSNALVLRLAEMDDRLQSMADMPSVEPGRCAERSHLGGPWTIREIAD